MKEGYNKISVVSGSMISAKYACGLISDKTGADAEAAEESAEDAAESESNAEAWAVGQRGGVNVDSDDPTFHNNSKYYSEQAGNSATTAGSAATQAQGYASTAAGAVEPAQAAQAAAEEAAQEAIDTVVAAQGPGIVYMTQDGEFFVLDDYEEE